LISESQYWKEELARWSAFLQRRMNARKWSDRSHGAVEKAAIFGFFAIRRLHESGGRLSDETVALSTNVRSYPRKSDYMTTLNRVEIDRHFDLEHPTQERRPLLLLMNQFIHSYVFSLVLAPQGGLSSILVCSDWQRTKRCFEVPAISIVRIFHRASRDNPSRVDARYDARRRDFIFSAHP
jgi:hypothetical protein